MNMAKRVIILNKLNSPIIAQAIFILKEGAECEFSAVVEAERIVADYMADSSAFAPKRRLMPVVIAALITLGALLAVIMGKNF